MYKKMLVPLDGSSLPECVLAHVRAIGAGCGIPQVVLLTVVEPLPNRVSAEVGESLMIDIEKKAQEDAKDYLAKLAEALRKDGVAAETAIVSGKPDHELLDYVKENQIDLVIMSTHGRTGISRWVLGSVADRVLHHCPVPVLLVPPGGSRAD